MSNTNAKYKRKIQISTINVKHARQCYVSHDSISFESCWAPDINVHLSWWGSLEANIVFL